MSEKKIRIDNLLVKKKLVETITLAQRMVMAGEVRVDGELIFLPSIQVKSNSTIEITNKPRYVSRGGEKLASALDHFGFKDLSGVIAVDVGSSTGGFTDCMLQHGATKVYAIDVGYGILHWKLRNDERVVVMERTNARFVKDLPEDIHLVTIDASFISLKVLLPVVQNWFGQSGGRVIALIKPQFEASRCDAAKEVGVIRDIGVHKAVLQRVLGFILQQGFSIEGLIRSPIKGPKGNIEFLTKLTYPPLAIKNDVNYWIERMFRSVSVDKA